MKKHRGKTLFGIGLLVFLGVFVHVGFLDYHFLPVVALGGDEDSLYDITIAEVTPRVLGDIVSDESAFHGQISVERFLPYGVFTPQAHPTSYELAVPSAHASIVLDVDSGTILHYEDGRDRRPVASLTKMMTALIVMEELDFNDVVTITPEMRNVEGTVVGCPRSGYCIDTRLQIGERIRVEELMKATLMNSANDAATALAIHIDGSVEEFAQRMNNRARAMGLDDTNFCTPSGLEREGRSCYSSAYDIARIVVKVLDYDEPWEIMNLPSGTVIESVDGKYEHEILNTNALLGQYDGLVGTKTGFTPDAGYCLTAVAEHPETRHRIVTVVLDDPYRWADMQDMISWSFDSYEWR